MERRSRVSMGTVLAVTAALAVASGVLSAAGGRATVKVPGASTSEAEVALGRRLFFDPVLSSNGRVSCATCHRPDRGFSDGLPVSIGVSGVPLKRHTPHLFNLAWNRTFFWDGRATSLEQQALEPIRNLEEMGLPGDGAAEKVRAIQSYVDQFAAVYPRSGVTMKNLAKALAAFERSLVSLDSAFDRYESGDVSAMSEPAVRGRELFFGRAKCSTCHSGPHFTDGQFHNTGVMSNDQGRAAFDRVGEFQMRPYPFFQMRQAFKTPSLRNVALTAPYQHDGSEETLEKVVQFYNAGGRDPRSYGKALDIKPLGLTDAQVADLVQFLETLTSPVLSEPSQTARAF